MRCRQRLSNAQLAAGVPACINAAVGRLPFIDWARGFAVFAMILWHTGDGWLRLDQREGQTWLALRFVGGLAAPGFIFLAGCAAALAARAPQDRESAQRAFLTAASRALEVLMIGYALRLQTWLLDAGAFLQWWLIRAWLPIGVGYGVLVLALRQMPESTRKAAPRVGLAIALAVVGFLQVDSLAPGRLARLLQVDVLQAIGASLFLLALGQRFFGLLRKPGALALLGILVAAITDSLTHRMPGPLPRALAAYLAKFEVPQGLPVPALFPLFPWFAYALLGAAWGALLKREKGREERFVVVSALFGASLALATSEAQPFVRALIGAQPWLVQPIRVGFRVGIVLTILLVGWLWVDGRRGKLWLSFGQNSMRIYWAHMLFAYGVLGRGLQKQLSFTSWALWLLPLFGAMWWLTRISGMPGGKARLTSVSPTKPAAGNVRT
jgi:uncharacterized membrane protein